MEPAAAKFLMALIILTRSSAFLFSKWLCHNKWLIFDEK